MNLSGKLMAAALVAVAVLFVWAWTIGTGGPQGWVENVGLGLLTLVVWVCAMGALIAEAERP